ncbi:MAG: MurT ligase domain-containing protein, partial [Candidatus Saccharimonadales bacterium]
TTDTVVLNREDPRVRKIATSLTTQTVAYFGLAPNLTAQFPNDDDLRSNVVATKQRSPAADVVLQSLDDHTAQFMIGQELVTTSLQLHGVYNVYNAAAALALTRQIVGDTLDQPNLIKALSQVTPAFGRGETITVGGQPLELVLVKNPSGFRLSLSSFAPTGYCTMIAVNDNYADGRDMSWLWDVEFDSLRPAGVSTVTGVRAYDMALRLQYDEVEITQVEPDISTALRLFIAASSDSPKRIFCTYTAMLTLRRELAKITTVEQIS